MESKGLKKYCYLHPEISSPRIRNLSIHPKWKLYFPEFVYHVIYIVEKGNNRARFFSFIPQQIPTTFLFFFLFYFRNDLNSTLELLVRSRRSSAGIDAEKKGGGVEKFSSQFFPFSPHLPCWRREQVGCTRYKLTLEPTSLFQITYSLDRHLLQVDKRKAIDPSTDII